MIVFQNKLRQLQRDVNIGTLRIALETIEANQEELNKVSIDLDAVSDEIFELEAQLSRLHHERTDLQGRHDSITIQIAEAKRYMVDANNAVAGSIENDHGEGGEREPDQQQRLQADLETTLEKISEGTVLTDKLGGKPSE